MAEKFNQVYLAAAKVGGIHSNDAYLTDFIYQNLFAAGQTARDVQTLWYQVNVSVV